MAGGSDGYRATLGASLRRGRISSLLGTAGLPPFISFSTSYPELDSAVRRRIRSGGRKYIAVAPKLMHRTALRIHAGR
jgi:hypothetical protein